MQTKQAKVKQKKSQPASKNVKVNLQNNYQLKDTVRVSNLSQGTINYSRVLANPFTGPMCGIPSYPSLMSFKQRAWAKGVLTVGVGTTGFIYVNPEFGAFSNLGSLYFSLPNYAGTTFAAPPTVGVQFAASNSNYVSSIVGINSGSACFRTVAAGVRIRYVGTELNRGGYIVGFSDPTHDDLTGRDVASVDGEETSRRFPVTREWTTILYRPIIDQDLQYTTDPNFGVNIFPDYYMGFLINSVAGNNFEYEYFNVAEFQGRNIRGMSTTSHDPSGFAAVNHISQVSPHFLPNQTPHEQREGGVLASVGHYLANGISHVTQAAAGEAQRYLTDEIEKNGVSGLWGALNKSLQQMGGTVVRQLPGLLV